MKVFLINFLGLVVFILEVNMDRNLVKFIFFVILLSIFFICLFVGFCLREIKIVCRFFLFIMLLWFWLMKLKVFFSCFSCFLLICIVVWVSFKFVFLYLCWGRILLLFVWYILVWFKFIVFDVLLNMWNEILKVFKVI